MRPASADIVSRLTMVSFPPPQFPYRDVAFKAALASGIGLLVGLEREWSRKEIGVRTFAISVLLGMLTALLSPAFVLGGLCAILILVGFLNVHSLLRDRSLELTTSISLVVVFFLGVMVGEEHYFTAATSAIVMLLLLSWKLELERFAGALRPEEIRSAVLLGLLSVVIFPLLPDRFVDPWDLINPHQFWMIVVVIAGIGFLNYVLLRIYGTRGIYYAAALGGLVNSTAAAAELSSKFRGREEMVEQAIAVLLLTNIAMFLRNVVILAIFARAAAGPAAWTLGTMAAATALWVWLKRVRRQGPSEPLKLSSPVSLVRVLKFSVAFLILSCSGTLAERYFGSLGFLAVSVLGGLVSSASTTAAAASLAALGRISAETAALATILTSVSSSLVNLPLVYQQTRQVVLMRRLASISIFVVMLGGVVFFVVHWMHGH
jgi:uncharacterized membrane protein (DUF4010 family)